MNSNKTIAHKLCPIIIFISQLISYLKTFLKASQYRKKKRETIGDFFAKVKQKFFPTFFEISGFEFIYFHSAIFSRKMRRRFIHLGNQNSKILISKQNLKKHLTLECTGTSDVFFFSQNFSDSERFRFTFCFFFAHIWEKKKWYKICFQLK